MYCSQVIETSRSISKSSCYLVGLAIALFTSLSLNAQDETYKLSVTEISNPDKVKLNFEEEHADSISVVKELQKLLGGLHAKSYLLASADSEKWNGTTLNVELHVGKPYKWANVGLGNLSEEFARKIGFKEKVFRNKAVRPKEFFEMENKLINYAASNGHPFAEVKLDSIIIKDEKIEGVLAFDKGQKITFDTLRIKGKTKVNRKFLQNYLQIKPGVLFDQSKLDRIKSLINQIRALKLNGSYRLKFSNNKAQVILNIEDRKTNTIDGIAGFQQNPTTNRLLFTGQFDLGLQNIAGRGKSVEMHWKKTDVNSQQLNASYEHLSLFGSGFHGNASFKLFKQDTSFTQRKPRFELFRNHPVLGKISFHYKQDDSRTIGQQVIPEGIVPTFSSVKTNYYGLGLDWNNLDNVNFPRKGMRTFVEGSVGNKKVLDSQVADLTDQNSLQIQTNVELERHFKINRYLGSLVSVKSSMIQNDQLFQNELYRLGGIQSWRGFREYQFYASRFVVGTLEGRFFLDQQSYLLVFADYGAYENGIQGDKPVYGGNPLGLGAGLTFVTKSGIFSFIYALGKEGSQPFNFNNSVINFGLTSRF